MSILAAPYRPLILDVPKSTTVSMTIHRTLYSQLDSAASVDYSSDSAFSPVQCSAQDVFFQLHPVPTDEYEYVQNISDDESQLGQHLTTLSPELEQAFQVMTPAATPPDDQFYGPTPSPLHDAGTDYPGRSPFRNSPTKVMVSLTRLDPPGMFSEASVDATQQPGYDNATSPGASLFLMPYADMNGLAASWSAPYERLSPTVLSSQGPVQVDAGYAHRPASDTNTPAFSVDDDIVNHDQIFFPIVQCLDSDFQPNLTTNTVRVSSSTEHFDEYRFMAGSLDSSGEQLPATVRPLTGERYDLSLHTTFDSPFRTLTTQFIAIDPNLAQAYALTTPAQDIVNVQLDHGEGSRRKRMKTDSPDDQSSRKGYNMFKVQTISTSGSDDERVSSRKEGVKARGGRPSGSRLTLEKAQQVKERREEVACWTCALQRDQARSSLVSNYS